MKVSGASTLKADPDTLWKALNDPAVLVATIPGCRRLEALGDDTYAMTVAAGVGSIKGVYDGQYSIADQAEPGTYLMRARGAGAAGTIDATVAVRLEGATDGSGGTLLSYDADAVVGGMIGGVGQRMLTGVSKKLAAEFFGNVDGYLAGVEGTPSGATPGVAAAPNHPGSSLAGGPDPSTVASATPGSSPAAAGRAPGGVWEAPNAPRGNDLVTGIAIGAVAALAGAVIGGWIAGRRR